MYVSTVYKIVYCIIETEIQIYLLHSIKYVTFYGFWMWWCPRMGYNLENDKEEQRSIEKYTSDVLKTKSYSWTCKNISI